MIDVYEPTSRSAWSERMLEIFYSSDYAREKIIADFKENGITLVDENNKLRNLDVLYEEFMEGAKAFEEKKEQDRHEAVEAAFDEFVDAVAERIRQKEKEEGSD